MRPRAVLAGWVVVAGILSAGSFVCQEARGEGGEASLSIAQGRDAALTRDSAGKVLPFESGQSLADSSWSAASPLPFKRNAAILDKKNPPTPRRSPLLISLYVSHGLLQALDAHATNRALRTGAAQEGNPLIRPIATQPAAFIAFKLGVAVGIIYGIDRLHKHHPRLAMITLGAINGGYLYFIQRSYRSFPAR
jgi:hypothetical protein